MSTFAETLRQAIGDMTPGDNHEVQIRLKPLTQPSGAPTLGPSAAPSTGNPQLPSAQTSSAGTGSLGGLTRPTGPMGGTDPGQMLYSGDPVQQPAGLVPGLTNAPLQLDTAAPLGSQTDSIYEAGAAQLAQAAQQRNLDILQQLGYVNQANGQLIPGTLETEAIRQRYELNRQITAAQREVDEGASRGGTVFSGRRAQLQGLRTEPLYQNLANVDTDLNQAVADALRNMGDIKSNFTVDRNMLIAEAAERARQRAIQNAMSSPGGGGGTGSGGGGGGVGSGGAAPAPPVINLPPSSVDPSAWGSEFAAPGYAEIEAQLAALAASRRRPSNLTPFQGGRLE